MVDNLKSIAFIGEKGSLLERERFICILNGTNPRPENIRWFIELQNPDGSFPFRMSKGNLGTINETTVALWWMEELNLLSSPTGVKALDYLLAAQGEDGSWDENPAISQYDLPSWIQLGDPKTRLYLSAYATYWLAVGGKRSDPAFRKALHFLLRHQDRSGKFFGYFHTTWIATGVFLLAGERYDRIARLGLSALSSRPLAEWDDSQIAWALDCLSAGGLPKTHPFIEECLQELFHRQRSDGSWASEDGEDSAVGATIQVIKVMKRYGLLVSTPDGPGDRG